MKIGEFSKLTGVSQRMLRYYENEGLLQPIRSVNGYREYDQRSYKLVRHIKNLSDAGIKLEFVKVLLPCLSEKEDIPRFIGCPEVKTVLRGELEKLNTKLEEITESRNAVAKFLDELVLDSSEVEHSDPVSS